MKTYPFLDPPSKPGDLGQLGHYRVMSELGSGGMGRVFRARDVNLKRAVALKVMNERVASTPHSKRRFLREARAMAAVHHDNVATIFEVGESHGTPFMAMEMLSGATLEQRSDRNGCYGYHEIIDIARQMAKGLAAAHAKGIVHRDIKPANIWIELDSARVKILDFGLALASSPVDELSARRAVVGTPGYLSPEQAMSEPLDDRSDLYSLGVVLYELCTGRLPHPAKTVPLQLISILIHRPTPIGELNAEIPGPLCDLIHRLLRKEPRSRPSSAQKLLEELERVDRACQAKSEVAQAITKLQIGLQDVVSKQANTSLFEFDTVPGSLSVPLARPPSASNGSMHMIPVGGAVRKSPTGVPTAVASPIRISWPLAAVLITALITLSLIAYWGLQNFL